MEEVENEENRLDKDRETLEGNLKKRKEQFLIDIQEICQIVDGIPTLYDTEYMRSEAV